MRTKIHRLAGRYLKREWPGHGMQTTALVNEAYLGLIDWNGVNWQNRAYSLGVAAQITRHHSGGFRSRAPAGRAR